MPVIPTLVHPAQPLAPLQIPPVVPFTNAQLAALLKTKNAPANVVQIFSGQPSTNPDASAVLPPQTLDLGVLQTTDLQFVGSLWRTKLDSLVGLNVFLVVQAADIVGPQGIIFGLSGSTSNWRPQVTIKFGGPLFDLYVIEFYVHNHTSNPYVVEMGYGAFNNAGDGTGETVLTTETVSPTSNTGPVLLSVTKDQAATTAFLRFPATPGYQGSISLIRIHGLSF